MDGWKDGRIKFWLFITKKLWGVEGRVEGWESGVKDCLQQSKIDFSIDFNHFRSFNWHFGWMVESWCQLTPFSCGQIWLYNLSIFDCCKQSLTRLWLPSIHPPFHPSTVQGFQNFLLIIFDAHIQHFLFKTLFHYKFYNFLK